MAGPQEEKSLHEDTIRVVLKVLQLANEPLTIEKVQRQLPGPFRVDRGELVNILEEQLGKGAVHPWPSRKSKKRFWTQAPTVYARDKVLDILSTKSLTRTELDDALKKSLFGCSKSAAEELRKRTLKDLLKERRLFEHLPVGRQRKSRFGLRPADPRSYLGKIRKEFEILCDRLKRVGIPPQALFHAATEMLKPGISKSETGVEFLISRPEAAPARDLQKEIVEKIVEIEPAARQQALVSIRELRGAMKLPHEIFDRAVLDLADEGRIWLHRHAYPAQAKSDEVVIDTGGNHYMGLVLRS
jgi:hypothetical protein